MIESSVHGEIASADGEVVLRLTLEPKSHDEAPRTYAVSVTSATCAAATRVHLASDDLVGYFDNLAEHWRGWDGPRVFTARPAGSTYSPPALQLTATFETGGHILIRIELGSTWIPTRGATDLGDWELRSPGSWAMEVMLELEAGQLDHVAAALRSLPPDSVGFW